MTQGGGGGNKEKRKEEHHFLKREKNYRVPIEKKKGARATAETPCCITKEDMYLLEKDALNCV